MTASKAAIALVACVVAVAGYLLLPRSDERIAMLVRDGKTEEATVELEKLVEQGDKRPRVLAALARLYLRSGHADRAAAVMQSYARLVPDDIAALELLADMHGEANDPDATLAVLERLTVLAPTAETLSRMLSLARLHGRYEQEQAALRRLEDRGRLGLDDRLRLVDLMAANGDQPAATSLLLRIEPELPPTEDRARNLLFEMLIVQQRWPEASAIAQRWLSGWSQPWTASRLMVRLARDAPEGPVTDLALASADMYPDQRFTYAMALIDAGRPGSARALLDRWIRQLGEPDEPEIDGFLAVVGRLREPRLALKALATLAGRPTALTAQAALAEAVSQMFGDQALASLRGRLPFETLARRPLFAARLALRESKPMLAAQMLLGVAPAGLNPADRKAWATLLRVALPEEAALTHMTSMLLRNRLPADLLPQYLDVARRLGHGAEYGLGLTRLARADEALPTGARAEPSVPDHHAED